MTITIEKYRIVILIALASFILTFVNQMFGGPDLLDLILMIPIIGTCLFGALVALTNIKSGEIKAYWKKEDKLLVIPFQQGQGIIAHDIEGQRYKLGVLFTPKKIN